MRFVRSLGTTIFGGFISTRPELDLDSSVITIESNRYELLLERMMRQFIELRDGRQTLVTLDLDPFLKQLQEQTAAGIEQRAACQADELGGRVRNRPRETSIRESMGTSNGSSIQLESANGEALLKINTQFMPMDQRIGRFFKVGSE